MGINTPKKNRTDVNVADQLLMDGLRKNAATIQSIAIGGVSETTNDIIATLQSRIDSANAVSSSKATWQAAVQADRTNHDKTRKYVAGVRQALVIAFAGKVDSLAQFGLTARKTAVVSPDELVARTAQALATRKARHTMGKKQKAEIKGTVAPPASTFEAPSPTPTPTPPAAPAPAPVSPAPLQTAPATSPAAPAPVSPAPAQPAAPSSPAPAQPAAPSSPVPPATTASTTTPAIQVTPTTTHGA